MDSDIPDPYKTLGVPKDAELSTIKSAYRKLALKCHPDKVSDPDQKAVKQKEFYGIQQAYEVLGDDFKRREYDAQAKLQERMRGDVFSGTPKSSPRSSSKGYYEPSYQNVNIRTAEPPKSFKASPTSAGFKSGPNPGPYPFPQYAGSWERDMPTRSKPIFDDDRKARRAQSYEKPSRRDEEAREAREAKEAKEERRRRREEEDRIREEMERRQQRERRKAKEAEREREREYQERKAREKRERQELKEAEEKEIRKQQKKREQEAKERDRDRARQRAQDEKMRSKKEPYIETDEEDPRLLSKKKSSGTKKHVSPSRREKSSRSKAEPEIMVKMDNSLMAAADYMAHTRRRGSKGEHTGYSPEASFTSQFPNPSGWQSEGKKFTARVEEEEPEIIEVATPPRHPPRLTKSYTMPAGMMHTSAAPNSSAPRVPSLNRAATGLESFQSASRTPAVPPAPDRHSRSERRRKSVADDDHHVPRHTSYRYPIHDEGTPRVGARYVDTDDFYGSSGGQASFRKVKMAERLSPEDVYSQGSTWDQQPVSYSHVPHDVQYSRPIYSR